MALPCQMLGRARRKQRRWARTQLARPDKWGQRADKGAVTVGLSRGDLKTQLGVGVQSGEEMHEDRVSTGHVVRGQYASQKTRCCSL